MPVIQEPAITHALTFRAAETAPRQPRAQGRLRVGARRRDGRTVLADLFQQGASRALLPRGAGPALTAVTLNTAGGMTGGDRFDVAAEAAPGAHLVMTTQAAERAYRAQPGETATLTCRLSAGPGARIDWLPQETILFDACALQRRFTADLAEDATLLFVEPILFGRRAMGETVETGLFRDRVEVRRGGELVFADATRIEGRIAERLAQPAVAGGAAAMAAVLLVAPAAETLLAPLRALLPDTAGASLIRPGVLFARLLAEDGYGLRQSLVPAIARLAGAPLPRTWML